MTKHPLLALIALTLAAAVLVVALGLLVTPVAKPSWSSEPGTGKAIQLMFCVAPLFVVGALLGLPALAAIRRSRGR